MHKAVRGALWAALVFSWAGMAWARPAVEARLAGAREVAIEFAQPMQNWDNAVRRDLVRTTPALPLACAWDSDTRLTCQAEQAFALATRYRLDLAAGLKTQTGKVLGAQVMHVETRRPEVRAWIARWERGHPAIELSSDMPVDAAALQAVLRLRLDGKGLALPPLRALPPRWAQDLRFGFDVPRVQSAGSLLQLQVQPGLRSSAGPLPGRQETTLLRARLNDPFALLGVSCEGADDGVREPVRNGAVVAVCAPGEAVTLVFSRPLNPASRAQVDAQVRAAAGQAYAPGVREVHWYAMASPFDEDGVDVAPGDGVDIGRFAPSRRFQLTLDGAIRSSDGAALPAVTVQVQLGDAQPHLLGRQRALVAAGAQPPSLVEAVNVGEMQLDVRGVGAQVRDETVQVRTPRQGSEPQPVASTVAAQTLAEGGWVRWTPLGKQGSRRADPRSWNTSDSATFAAPAFDLLAVTGRREVLAWANEWETDAPVAGAAIELLWLDPGALRPRVVATGTTQADGTVLLRLPDDLALPTVDADEYHAPDSGYALWLLRAATDAAATYSTPARRGAVLPMHDADPYSALGRTTPRHTWGVSDRPLYRAGDTVHYRLWQRQLDGTRLRAPRADGPVPLRLQNGDDDKIVLEWSATPAADGSIAGELLLPVHLTDATYCIGRDDGHHNTDGTCFFVGTYRAQDLWLEARSRGGVLRDGDRFVADARAGYFSGGPAAGAEITQAEVRLEPEPLGAAYPQYADFSFIGVYDDDTTDVALAGIGAYKRLDGDGALHVDVPVAFAGTPEQNARRPAFGLLTTGLEVSPEDREGTSAYEQATRYARYDRYVGLRTRPDWFGAEDPVRLEAVVITAQGKEVTAEVEVSIEYLPGYDRTQPGEPIAHCRLRTRQSTPCAFARERTGLYRLTARSGDAAPATLQRYVWWRGGGQFDPVDQPELAVQDGSPQRDRPARLLLRQDFARARALLVTSFGGSILAHRVEAIEGSTQELTLPMARDWRGRLTVHALVRESTPSRVEAGFRQPVRLRALDAYLPAAELATDAKPISLRFQSAQARPGQRARITLRNDSTQPRQVTLAVMDDALRAQAQRWLPYTDPAGATGFRESLLLRGEGGIDYTGFQGWDGDEWRWLLPWDQAGKDAYRYLRERAQPVAAMAPPPAPPAAGEATSLDRITVTGSRIKRSDLVESNEAKAPDASLRLEREASRHPARPSAAAIAVRSRFADTALWLPDIRLAPGESREVEVALPDNLTRWRAVAWSADDGDGFAMTEAALEAGLPVEARLQAPVRVYPGDTARVATSVRHVAATAATATTTLQVRGEGANANEGLDDTQTLALAPRGQASVAATLQPQVPGELRLVATARTPAGGDAVAGSIEVASPLISTRRLQAGWIGADALHLDLPAMPEHAHDPALRVSLLRGGAGLTSQWTQDLRDYPHRCWEQILSRAVGAALALERQDASWPDAADVVREALDNAAVFQLDDGGFVYFHGWGDQGPDASVTLTAYTLRAFALLRELGHPVPSRVEAQAREFLGEVLADAPSAPAKGEALDDDEYAGFAFAAAAQSPQDSAGLDRLWTQWKHLPLPLQVASTQAFARARHPAAARALKRVLAAAPARGPARSLRLSRRYDAWMSSDMREQCALVDLLRAYPQLADARVRRELLAGMNDLYAGGVASVDTQTAAYCLMALREPAGAAAAPASASFAIGTRAQALELAAGQDRADWNAGAPDGPQLQVAADAANTVPVSYVAELRWQEDARLAQESAIGLAITRRHEVLRDGAWKAVDGQTLHEGDWIRISLTVRTSAQREFVAVTDAVPGGLQPSDLALSGVGNTELKRIADAGSGYFGSRKLDARHPRFYAESLPPGEHAVRYFARVGNSGDYLAAPAEVELMYGQATHARTAATRLRIEAPAGR
ncbi:alpha-2-macroglobulin family protein [Lysobacter solisilvae (ex Woo and Kim 2020)]|uniref:Alpha-2-macroglobulin domain-containing protein n=1 Tax=Agrilutibacter terrestris TaxID=2865112 RepID=A0A7H0FU39_9GAMM|nr:alpha-2-macroglobulin family protein [Lysobacter terrestris]QNP39555.1 hypothetical protein H8B22_08425 [Lysobacter terrestris]